MLGAMAGLGGGGLGFTGGASGAEGYQTTNTWLDTGFGGMGGFHVGNYYGKGSTSSVIPPVDVWVLAGVGVFVAALWLLKKKK